MASSAGYGRKGQVWHPAFIKYMKRVYDHPTYRGMPDAMTDDGRIQWEAPSNRQSGRFRDTHHKRREWWIQKAKETGIDIRQGEWISRTAKTVHPFGEKPCKRCGTVMELRYAYPTKTLLKKTERLGLGVEPPATQTIDIRSLIRRIHETHGGNALATLHALFGVSAREIPNGGRSLQDWLTWLDQTYIPSEPALLSPGAMSNAPDRFDGFHSFNLCCRSRADTGRHDSNLRLYTTDRRVFEYWSDGDWIAADRLMGEIRARFRGQTCANGHSGPCDADHIGPISLGFAHHPYFRLLCSQCNSAKNNRMTFADVVLLRRAEEQGTSVVSWHSSTLWNLRMADVTDNETALRLSKLLRDNRHSLMYLLSRIAERGHYAFLATLLHLSYAEFDVEFVDLRIEKALTVYGTVRRTARETKYAEEQKARRCRIAFSELMAYQSKENRNSYTVWGDEAERYLQEVLRALDRAPASLKGVNEAIAEALQLPPTRQENAFRALTRELARLKEVTAFASAHASAQKAMASVARGLSAKWSDERYVRSSWS